MTRIEEICKVAEEFSMYADLFAASRGSKLSNTYSHIGTSYKCSSTKKGKNPKAIKTRRKKNKNKKTHRR